jgi:hypothetical protein
MYMQTSEIPYAGKVILQQRMYDQAIRRDQASDKKTLSISQPNTTSSVTISFLLLSNPHINVTLPHVHNFHVRVRVHTLFPISLCSPGTSNHAIS